MSHKVLIYKLIIEGKVTAGALFRIPFMQLLFFSWWKSIYWRRLYALFPSSLINCQQKAVVRVSNHHTSASKNSMQITAYFHINLN